MTEFALNEQVGVDVATGDTEHVNATVPVKVLAGATVITEVPELPATIETGLVAGVNVKVGPVVAVTVTAGEDMADAV
jgi:hydrogenase maturation factor